jgi:HrpA-like RNA helicase
MEANAVNPSLPICGRREEIVESVKNNRVTIIVAETGSGKSSQVIRYEMIVACVKVCI